MESENAWNKISTTVDIKLEDEVITYKTLTRILQSVIEFLSYNRNQIPFVYETFNHMVNGFKNKKIEDIEMNMTNIALERQRNLAIQIRNKFEDLSKVIKDLWRKCHFQRILIKKEFRFVFSGFIEFIQKQ